VGPPLAILVRILQVYAGQWRGLPVAVKVVSQAAPLDGQLVAEFRREIATMAALPPHPHVLPLLAACTAPPHLALVTPFCARGALNREMLMTDLFENQTDA
jgi:serine/threonine protein kinase